MPETALCMKCTYSLAGLQRSGVCPECGTPIALSLRDSRLINSDPDYLATLHNGVFLVQASIITQIVVMMAVIFTSFFAGIMAGAASSRGAAVGTPAITILSQVFSLVIAAMGILGWWRLSAPDPRALPTNRGEKPRRIVRTVVLIEACFTAIWQLLSIAIEALNLSGTTMGMGAGAVAILMSLCGLASFVLLAIRFFASMQYLRWLAPRVPNRKLFVRGGRMMWLGPVLCTVGVVLLGLGPLIALVMYYNMLEWLRKDLKRIRVEQASPQPTA